MRNITSAKLKLLLWLVAKALSPSQQIWQVVVRVFCWVEMLKGWPRKLWVLKKGLSLPMRRCDLKNNVKKKKKKWLLLADYISWVPSAMNHVVLTINCVVVRVVREIRVNLDFIYHLKII